MRGASAPKVPPLAERVKPGLSVTLTGPRHPDRCQSCGASSAREAFTRWIECDEWDQATRTTVVLCVDCSVRLIESHPRLYRRIWPNAPWAGAMALCVDCRHRDGLLCRHPELIANGGRGLEITTCQPTMAHLNYGGGRGEFVQMYASPPSACAGRELRTIG